MSINFKRAVCCQPRQDLLATVTLTKHGLRLSQHGVVISELRTTPGPTHSVVDVLTALIAVLAPVGRIVVLGFAGGGMIAPLHALGVETAVDSVDLDRVGYTLFRKHCPEWIDRVNWQQGDAGGWLRQQPDSFGLLVDDLSVPNDGDVVKPSISWKVLPRLIRQRLQPGGFGVFNLLPRSKGKWNPDLGEIVSIFKTARIIKLDEFQNRILVTSDKLPGSREIGQRLRPFVPARPAGFRCKPSYPRNNPALDDAVLRRSPWRVLDRCCLSTLKSALGRVASCLVRARTYSASPAQRSVQLSAQKNPIRLKRYAT